MSVTAAVSYHYRTQLEERGEIRLFTVRQEPGHPIACTFFYTQLVCSDEHGDGVNSEHKWRCDLPYIALSYTWGTEIRDIIIEVDGRPFAVTQNLYKLLRDVCLARPEDLFWADAICIDQGNHAEKGHQVQQMPSIYEAAEQVYIHLAQNYPSPELEILMQAQKSFDRHTRGEFWPVDSPHWHSRWSQSTARIGLDSRLTRGEQTKAMKELFSYPWFRRAWIIQEVAKARSAVIFCAGCRVSSRIFAVMPTLLLTEVGIPQQAILDIMPGPSRRTSWWAENRSLSNLLRKFRWSEARFSRDRIYALLGICSDSKARRVIVPDYEKSEDKLVRDMVAFLYSVPRQALEDTKLKFDDFFKVSGQSAFQVSRNVYLGVAENLEFLDLYEPSAFPRMERSGSIESAIDTDCLKDMWDELLDSEKASTMESLYWSFKRRPEGLGADLKLLDLLNASASLTTRRFQLSTNFFTIAKAVFGWAENWTQLELSWETLRHGSIVATAEELVAAASTRYAWRKAPTMQPRVVATAAVLPQGRDVAAAARRSELKRQLGQGAFSILRSAMSDTVYDGLQISETGELATLLSHNGDPVAMLQFLREKELVHAIPSSHVLVHALGRNKQHGQQLLHGILQDIIGDARVSKPQEQLDTMQRSQSLNQPFFDSLSPSCLSHFELLNIFTEYGHVEEIRDLLKSLTTHDQRQGPVLITSRSMSLIASRRGKLSLPHAILRLSKIFNLSFSLSGLEKLITACDADELRALLRADTRTADICRFLAIQPITDQCSLSVVRRFTKQQKAVRVVFEVDTELHHMGKLSHDIRNTISQYTEAQDEGIDSSTDYLAQFAYLIRASGVQENNILRSDRSTGLSPLTRAAAMGDVAAARELITHRAIMNEADDYGLSPLMWARFLNQQEMERLLRSAIVSCHNQTIMSIDWTEYYIFSCLKPMKGTYHVFTIELEDHDLMEDLVKRWISTRSWFNHEN